MPQLAGTDLRPIVEIAVILTGASLSFVVVRAAQMDLRVAALVVELGQETEGAIARQLSALLADPTLQIVFALDAEGRYVSAAGRDVTLPRAGSGRAVTLIAHGGTPVAALLHDPAIRVDPGVRTAITRAAELAGSNARLQAEVQSQLAEVAASRRRLLDAADEERRLLRAQLEGDLGPRLDELEAEFVGRRSAEDRTATADALRQLRETRADVAAIADGLHPRLVEELGLAGALHELARRSPVSVEVTVGPSVEGDLASQAGLYFVCSEALANAAKHARATAISIRLKRTGDLLVAEVEDDGIGGADAARGTGLTGLRDRIAALGGWLTVADRPGHGTRIVAAVPAGDQALRHLQGDGEVPDASPISRS
jgi:signal transduction histidine kinase